MPGGPHGAVRHGGPLAGRGRPDHLLHVAAEPWTGGADVDGQLEAAVLGQIRGQRGRLDVYLVGDQVDEGLKQGRVLGGHQQVRQG